MDISNNNNDEKMTHLDNFFSRISEWIFCFLSWTLEADLAVRIWTKCDSKKKWMFGAMRIIKKVLSGEVFLWMRIKNLPKVVSENGLGIANDQSKKLPQKNQKKTWEDFEEEKGWNSMNTEEVKEWKEDE